MFYLIMTFYFSSDFLFFLMHDKERTENREYCSSIYMEIDLKKRKRAFYSFVTELSDDSCSFLFLVCPNALWHPHLKSTFSAATLNPNRFKIALISYL